MARDRTYEELERAGLQAIKNGGLLMTADEFRKELSELRASFFDPNFEPMSTAKSPEGGLDIIQASSNNFYGPEVKLADLKNFTERYGLNSRVVKTPDGTLVEQVWRAGTPDGSVAPGLYAEFLNKAIGYLEQAKPYAEPGQAEVIDRLIRYYRTGEAADWLAVGEAWVQNRVKVDFSNGFVEVYRDPRGVKGASQGFVTVVDEGLNHIMTRLADNAQYFEERAPWKQEYKKLGVKPPVAMAVEPLVENGDFGLTTVGVNLPNESEIQEKYGTKNFFRLGSFQISIAAMLSPQRVATHAAASSWTSPVSGVGIGSMQLAGTASRGVIVPPSCRAALADWDMAERAPSELPNAPRGTPVSLRRRYRRSRHEWDKRSSINWSDSSMSSRRRQHRLTAHDQFS
jgi:hypothetical protein